MAPSAVASLAEWLQLLTICCKHRVGDHALVIYYDSLDATGQVYVQGGQVYALSRTRCVSSHFDLTLISL